MLEARSSLDRACQISPRFAEAHHNLGLVYLRMNEGRKCLAEFGIAAQLRPSDPQAHADYAGILGGFGDFKNAISEYEAAVSLAPDNKEYAEDLKRTERAALAGR